MRATTSRDMIVKICMIVDVERPRCSGGEVRIEERELRGSQDSGY